MRFSLQALTVSCESLVMMPHRTGGQRGRLHVCSSIGCGTALGEYYVRTDQVLHLIFKVALVLAVTYALTEVIGRPLI